MAGQPGFFDGDEPLKALSAASDLLERLTQAVDFEVLREDIKRALAFGPSQGRTAATRC